MSERPSFQFYPADWRKNAKLRRCSHAARGAWMDVLCLLHDAEDYGILRWPLADIAQASGVPTKLLRELVEKGVLKGADRNAPAFEYRPRHAGKVGDPVTLVAASSGPCWYCSRFVRDEYVRQRRGASTRFTTDAQPPRFIEPNDTPNCPPMPAFGEPHGDGASSSSSLVVGNTSTRNTHLALEAAGVCADPPPVIRPEVQAAIVLRKRGLQVNGSHPDLIAACAEGVTVQALSDLADAYPDKPAGYVIAAARRQHAERASPIPNSRAGPNGTPPLSKTGAAFHALDALATQLEANPHASDLHPAAQLVHRHDPARLEAPADLEPGSNARRRTAG